MLNKSKLLYIFHHLISTTIDDKWCTIYRHIYIFISQICKSDPIIVLLSVQPSNQSSSRQFEKNIIYSFALFYNLMTTDDVMIVDSVLSILVRFLQYDIFLYVKSLIGFPFKDSLRHEFRLKKIYPHVLCACYTMVCRC